MHNKGRGRRAFTIVDLLVAITIIAILAAVVFGAVGMARQQARIDRTQRLIDKLHVIIMTKYDSYRTRRVPLDLRQYVWAHAVENTDSKLDKYYEPLTVGWPKEIARARVNAIRDLMRMEMPDRWSDVIYDARVLRRPTAPAMGQETMIVPALTQRYRRIYNAASATNEWGAAECLYMIVMAMPDAAEQFHESEIGDVDGDGLPEFIDAWGTPIRFLRWPAGFYYDPDDHFYAHSDLQFGPELLGSGATNPKYQPDPFDPYRTIPTQESFALFPLIYSAGPGVDRNDRSDAFDINIGKTSGGNTHAYALDADGNLDPFKADGAGHKIGQPYNNDGDESDPMSFFRDLNHTDNIHNHLTPK